MSERSERAGQLVSERSERAGQLVSERSERAGQLVSPSPVARALRGGVRAYQAARAGRPSPCRFTPSCSAYAAEALEVHGAVRGSWLALRRLSRCRPLGGKGWDPVPPLSSPVPGPVPSDDGPSPLVDRTA